ncbi:MAG: pentapeptide repeat-containing protein [Nitrospira sp.]|nr:pentapeptide repeat-containing protein [Nitrospira sp.]
MESPISEKRYDPLPQRVVKALVDHQCWLASGGQLGTRLGTEEDVFEFAGYDLDGFDFSLAMLPLRLFTNSSLRGALFFKTELLWANFDGCDATGANFTGADIKQVSFIETKYPGACFKNAQLEGIIWTADDERFEMDNMKALLDEARANPDKGATLDCKKQLKAELDVAFQEWRKIRMAQHTGAMVSSLPNPLPM